MKLAELQRAFHDAVIGEAPLPAGLVHGDVRVYTNAYFARIHAVLVEDFPKLASLIDLHALVIPYLRAHPTTCFSLREAGAHLADFLVGVHADLARLERARVEAFDGADAVALTRDDLAAIAPDDFPTLRLRVVPTAALVEMSTNADELWDAIECGRDLPASIESPRSVLVWRRDLDVVHRTLDADEAAPLSQLARGATFADLCESFAPERALELLVRWLDAGVLAAG